MGHSHTSCDIALLSQSRGCFLPSPHTAVMGRTQTHCLRLRSGPHRDVRGLQDPGSIPKGQSRGWQGAGIPAAGSHIAELSDSPLPAPAPSLSQESPQCSRSDASAAPWLPAGRSTAGCLVCSERSRLAWRQISQLRAWGPVCLCNTYSTAHPFTTHPPQLGQGPGSLPHPGQLLWDPRPHCPLSLLLSQGLLAFYIKLSPDSITQSTRRLARAWQAQE